MALHHRSPLIPPILCPMLRKETVGEIFQRQSPFACPSRIEHGIHDVTASLVRREPRTSDHRLDSAFDLYDRVRRLSVLLSTRISGECRLSGSTTFVKPLTGFKSQSCNAAIGEGGCEGDVKCWPSGTQANLPSLATLYSAFYSPGLQCPSGMVTACAAASGSSSGLELLYPLATGETAVGCCPS